MRKRRSAPPVVVERRHRRPPSALVPRPAPTPPRVASDPRVRAWNADDPQRREEEEFERKYTSDLAQKQAVIADVMMRIKARTNRANDDAVYHELARR
jgi:hypothetical protein